MIIEEKDFRLKPIDDSSLMFDLELLYKVTPKGGESRLEFKTAAYGLSLETALKRVVQYRLSNKHDEEAVSLESYCKEFIEELDSLTKFAKQFKA